MGGTASPLRRVPRDDKPPNPAASGAAHTFPLRPLDLPLGQVGQVEANPTHPSHSEDPQVNTARYPSRPLACRDSVAAPATLGRNGRYYGCRSGAGMSRTVMWIGPIRTRQAQHAAQLMRTHHSASHPRR